MEILEFIFGDFWHFAGVFLMIDLLSGAIERMIKAANRKRRDDM